MQEHTCRCNVLQTQKCTGIYMKLNGRGSQLQCLQLAPSPTCLRCSAAFPCCRATPDGSLWRTQSLDPAKERERIELEGQ